MDKILVRPVFLVDGDLLFGGKKRAIAQKIPYFLYYPKLSSVWSEVPWLKSGDQKTKVLHSQVLSEETNKNG